MILGFTGTQDGMTDRQKDATHFWFAEFGIGGQLHHGDCLGADEDAHDIALSLGMEVYIHPPDNPSKRANCKGAKKVYMPKPYIMRNHNIVRMCERLIATPSTDFETIRSGTWATVRFAKRQCVPVTLLKP